MKIKNFSRKTIAIAVAAGMSLGGVTVAAPTAGATAGYKGGEFVPDYDTARAENPSLENEKDEKKVTEILSKYPKAQREDAPVWGLQGGYYSDIKVPEGTASGFAGRSTSGMVAPHVEIGYGPTQSLNSLKNKYLDIDRELSVDAKKVIFVAFSLVDDIQKNKGLSPSAKAKLSAAGYTGNYGKTPNPKTPLSPTFYGTSPQESEILVDSEGRLRSNVTPITAGDTLAEAAAVVAGAAMSADTNYRNPETYSVPASFDDISANLSEYVMNQNHGFLEASPDLGKAIINIARGVTTEDLAKADLKIRFSKDIPADAGITNEAVYNPVFFDITNSKPAPVEELPEPKPETPAKDIYVDNVEKDDNGNYVVTRNDGEKKWVIDLSDLNKAKKDIEGLKSKDEATQKELDKIKEEITKLEKSTIKEVKDNGDGTYTLIREDGTEVPGKIDTSGSVTNVKTDGKGNLIITIDGKDKKVPLAQTTIKESNKGKPNHTVTITTPDGKSVTFNVFDKHVTSVKKLDNGNYEVTRNDGTKWTIDLKDIRDQIAELEKKESPSKADFDKVKNDLDKAKKDIDGLKAKDKETDKAIQGLRDDLTKLEKRVTNLEKRVGALEDTDEAWAKCYAGIGESAVPLALAAPLALMSDMNIPGLNQLNTQIQRTIGIYNPEAAKWMADNRGLFTAATGVLTFAGVVAMLAHTAKECLPYNKTPGVQDNMNPIIEGSSKLGEKIESGSSKPEGEDEDNGSSVDAGSSIGDGSSTEGGSSTVEGSSEDE